MNWKEFFKIDLRKILLALIIFGIIVVFFLPAKVNVLCKPGAPCNPINDFISISEISTNPRFVTINYVYLTIELLVSYLISCSFIVTYNKLKK